MNWVGLPQFSVTVNLATSTEFNVVTAAVRQCAGRDLYPATAHQEACPVVDEVCV